MLEFRLTFDCGITHFLDLCGMEGSRYFSKHRRIHDLSSGSDSFRSLQRVHESEFHLEVAINFLEIKESNMAQCRYDSDILSSVLVRMDPERKVLGLSMGLRKPAFEDLER